MGALPIYIFICFIVSLLQSSHISVLQVLQSTNIFIIMLGVHGRSMFPFLFPKGEHQNSLPVSHLALLFVYKNANIPSFALRIRGHHN